MINCKSCEQLLFNSETNYNKMLSTFAMSSEERKRLKNKLCKYCYDKKTPFNKKDLDILQDIFELLSSEIYVNTFDEEMVKDGHLTYSDSEITGGLYYLIEKVKARINPN